MVSPVACTDEWLNAFHGMEGFSLMKRCLIWGLVAGSRGMNTRRALIKLSVRDSGRISAATPKGR